MRKLAAPGLLMVLPLAGQFVDGLHTANVLVAMVHLALLYGMRVAVAIVSTHVVIVGALFALVAGEEWLEAVRWCCWCCSVSLR
ncbi:hypothetical protein [Nonomuraea diastatica]|uniref:Uncharacterized protein n=1 Tax=Nonomuraea diastatica TaxID=1848329 RepID=A0A4R4W359_9ACTN|nr:hypothetical protein [Nonomuraea diastatica]TDD13019.1 hypothetical protein E1294_42530 [Nonomuraea diastatica]